MVATKPNEDKVEDKTKETKPEDPHDVETHIVHKQTYTDQDGVQHTRTHGPMPVSEWADYERKNNL